MKRILYILTIFALATACGGKDKTAGALTPEEETKLVDSLSQNLEEHTQEIKEKTDSVSAEVDSLLQDI